MCNNKGTLDIEQLDIQKIPLEILEVLTKSRWPVSGGWGYSREDAVVIELDDERDGVHLEYQFLEARCYLEVMKCASKGVKLEVLDIDRKMQNLVFGEGGKSYDKLTMEVTATLNGEEEVKYEVVGWFDISKFFGMN
jgi:hypothetical protein